VLGEHGARLAAGGVWVPGHLPIPRARAPGAGGGEPLLSASGVAASPLASGRRRARAAPVVSDVRLDVRAGRASCVVGPNGAGKSTLALAMAGLAAPVAGEVLAADELADGAARHPHEWRPRELVTRIGAVFQEPQHQFVAATVQQELAVGPDRIGLAPDETEARIAGLLRRLRLEHLARANPFTLSGGEQRRLSVATVLATRPRVLMLDEPTFGQDARTWVELVDLLGELLDAGSAVLAVTHDEALVAALAGTVLRLGEGAPAEREVAS
jgi:energy-coupling factor transporter ATP-binding protein EcfA2